jgi:electron transport complex protein RnfG
MAAKESTFVNMVVTLFIITGIASLALGGIYNLTKEPIAIAKKEKRDQAIREVIPAFDSLVIEKAKPADGKDSVTFFKGISGGELVGVAVSTYSNIGYDPTQIQMMVGFLPDGSISNTVVTQHKETPGLGTKMSAPFFKDQFKGKHPDNFRLAVKKDGGDVDAITAATITSRAFCDGVVRAYNTYKNQGGDKE